MTSPQLNSSTRSVTGKKVKLLRREGLIPAVVYGRDQASISLSVKEQDYEKIFGEVGTSTLVDLIIDDQKPVKVLLHEPQLHPVKPQLVHADFYVVKMTEKLQTEIPLELVGESPAVTELDGTLTIHIDALSVECFPNKLVPEISVDIASLKTFDDLIRISDIVAPEGIEILHEPDEVVVTITAPRSEEEMAQLEEAPTGEAADQAAVEAVEVEEKGKEEEETEE